MTEIQSFTQVDNDVTATDHKRIVKPIFIACWDMPLPYMVEWWDYKSVHVITSCPIRLDRQVSADLVTRKLVMNRNRGSAS